MSMPSSSDEVATSARSAPALSRSSTSTRCGRAIEPWCERTSVSPASSFSAPASRSARRRLLTKISVERCARIRFEQPRMDRRPDRRPRVAERRRSARDHVGPGELRHVLDRHFDRQLQRLLLSGVDDRDGPVMDDPLGSRTRARSRLSTPARRIAALSDVPELRRICGRLRRRQGTARLRRAGAASPTGRCAAAAARRSPRAARATAPGARRAWSGPARESRR